MNYKVIGTAGHIDHGKTLLTRALTGVDTDRLKEEKERNISIEPGFAPLELPSGMTASIVDVPGHERFIRQMVAGVAGIDFVMLVVAADDGVMPQTREHLQILHLLGISSGMVVLTKMDRADPELLPLIEEDIREEVRGTFLERTPVAKVSAATGEGIDHLIQLLDEQLSRLHPRKATGPFRLPVDRVFTIKGAGTVATGTVVSGSANVGDELTVLPGNHRVKIRQAQVHGRAVSEVFAGQRAALNLTHIDVDQIGRGHTLAPADVWRETQRIDIRALSLSDLSFALKHRSPVKLLIGTAEVLADLILYDRKEWNPGEEIFASLRLHRPIIAARGDRFILRRPSPSTTVGGGEVVDPYAQKLKIRPSSAETVRRKLQADLSQRILEFLEGERLLQSSDELALALHEPEERVLQKLKELEQAGRIRSFGRQVASMAALARKREVFEPWLKAHHHRYPMRPGVPKAEWVARFFPTHSVKELNPVLDYWSEQGILRLEGEYIALSSFRPEIPSRWTPQVNLLLETLKREGLTPSHWEDLLDASGFPKEMGEEIRQFLIRENTVVPLTDSIVIHREAFESAVVQVVRNLKESGSLTMQDIKQSLSLSRKYLVPLMERMDQAGITRRVGDQRVLANPDPWLAH